MDSKICTSRLYGSISEAFLVMEAIRREQVKLQESVYSADRYWEGSAKEAWMRKTVSLMETLQEACLDIRRYLNLCTQACRLYDACEKGTEEYVGA